MEIKYLNLDDIWHNGQFLSHPRITQFLGLVDHSRGCDHVSESCIASHLGEFDCMFGDEDLIEHFMPEYAEDWYEIDETTQSERLKSKIKLTPNDLAWYYVPHCCDTNALLIWLILNISVPDKTIQIIYIHDHFVCAEIELDHIYHIYDMDQYISHLEGQSKYNGRQHLKKALNKKEYVVISSDTIQAWLCSKKVDLYDIPAIKEFNVILDD